MSKLPGQLFEGDVEYLVKAPGQTPFCHLCRQRVDAVVVLTSGFNGNPLHCCKQCLKDREQGLEKITKANVT